MTHTNIFDITEGRRRRDEGMKKAAGNNDEFLAWARTEAKLYLRLFSNIDIDVLRQLHQHGDPPQPTTPNAWGSVFKHPDFEPELNPDGQQRMVQSLRPEAHGRFIRVWKIAGPRGVKIGT